MKANTPAQIERVNVDTTVQTKAVWFPTDSRLYDRAREGLVETTPKQGLRIKQCYERVGRRLLMAHSRYAQPSRCNGPGRAPANSAPIWPG
jgi:IS5 family transposase